MSSVVIAGNTSGTVTLLAPDIAGTTTLTLPTTSGTLVSSGGVTSMAFGLGSAASPSITFTGDTNTGIFSPGADTIGFAEGGTEVMRIDSSGNVGIGTANPTSRLHLSTSDNIVGKINSTNSGGPLLGLYKSGTAIGFVGVSGAWIGNTATDVALAAETGNGIGFFVNGSASNTGGFTSSGNFSFNSGYGSAATAYGCRAWVNFNGEGTPAIRASGNVSSITDVDTGEFRVNFSTAMPDANYILVGTCGGVDGSSNGGVSISNLNQAAPSTTSIGINTRRRDTNNNTDSAITCVAIFR
jgi:hypothetical protein